MAKALSLTDWQKLIDVFTDHKHRTPPGLRCKFKRSPGEIVTCTLTSVTNTSLHFTAFGFTEDDARNKELIRIPTSTMLAGKAYFQESSAGNMILQWANDESRTWQSLITLPRQVRFENLPQKERQRLQPESVAR